MIKLHGFPASNYYNMAKMALMEKGATLEEVRTYTGQSEEMLTKSPMGKVPFLEVDGQFITETSIILDYIEETQAGPSLYPADPFDRARVRELVRYSELYLELPARRCYGEAFFRTGRATEQTKEEVRTVMERGVKALHKRAQFRPYLFGDSLTYADIVFLYSYPMAAAVARSVLGWDLSADIPDANQLIQRLKARDTVKVLDADEKANMQEFRDAYGMK